MFWRRIREPVYKYSLCLHWSRAHLILSASLVHADRLSCLDFLLLALYLKFGISAVMLLLCKSNSLSQEDIWTKMERINEVTGCNVHREKWLSFDASCRT